MNLHNYHPRKCNIAPEVIAALIAGGSSMAGTAMSVGNQNQINTNNQALARQQNQWNLEQWYRENAYNTPLAQKQRLKEAGINPGLMYSSGIENISAQSPQMVSSQNQASARFDLGGVQAMQAYQQSRLADAEVKLKDSQTDLNIEKIPLMSSLTSLNHIKFNILGFDLNELKPLEKKNLEASAKKLNQECENLSEQLHGITIDNAYKNMLLDKERFYQHFYMNEDFQSTIDLRKSTIFKNRADAAETVYLMGTKMALMRSDIMRNRAQAGLFSEEAKTEANKRYYYDQVGNYYKSHAGLIDVEKSFKSRLYSSPGYVQGLVDSVTLQNNKITLDMNIEKGRNAVNLGYGTDFDGYDFFTRMVGTFEWSLNHVFNVFGRGSRDF